MDRALHRSSFLRAAIAAGAAASFPLAARAQAQSNPFAAIERRYGGRLGVSVIDLQTGAASGHRENERFAMCSTFKFFLVADILAHVDAGTMRLSQWVPYSTKDLLEYAPVTRAHVASGGMSLEALCSAAIEYSDNGAANLLLGLAGGPAGATRFVRKQGDDTTRLDRTEPQLNSSLPNDPRDTTTPLAMRTLMNALLLGNALQPRSVQLLESWMIACKTGLSRLRAGVPKTWKVGDKTGTGERGAAGDLAIMWPPGRKPLLVAAYYSGPNTAPANRDAVFAGVGTAVGRSI
ncbi:MAG TPA: class A beta-lactamase [Candidatus Cybelea sp.]|jgi:beta-lactamase class A|nr:class A beta-lactamase [Candidatus Cybelea sp.]